MTSTNNTKLYQTFNSHKCMGVNGEALQLHAVYKRLYFLLQVKRESVSGTLYKSRALHLNVQ